MYSFDTEDNSQGKVTVIDFFDGWKHTTFEGKDCRDEGISFLLNKSKGKDEFFATNLEYDLYNVFGAFYTKLPTLWYTPAGLMRAQLGSIRFYDTIRNWSMSVKQAGKYIGLEKIEGKGFGVERCRRDAEITYKLAEIMIDRYDKIGLKLKSTISSTAFDFWFKNFCNVPVYVKPEIRRFLIPSMYGGRCEIFRHGEVDQPVWDYDINSSYPFSMQEATFPDLQTGRVIVRPRKLPKDLDSVVGVAYCKVRHPKTYLGYLPYRAHGKLLFPIGEFWGVWTLNELSKAVALGVKIIDITYVVIFEPIANPFTNFVRYMYQKRLDTDDKFMKYLYKKILNCVYGKFAERGHLEIWKDGKVRVSDHIPFWSNIIFSSVINSTARSNLLAYLIQAQAWVCYTDTDSFVTLSKVGKGSLSTDLGGLKLCGAYKKANFILPKLYVLGFNTIKCKGIRKDRAKQFIRDRRISYKDPISFKESMSRLDVKQNVWVDREKMLRANYDKRIVLPDGRTKPKEVKDGVGI